MARYIILIICFATSCGFSQEVVYFNENWYRTSKDSAMFLGVPQKQGNAFYVCFFRLNGTIAREGHYKDLDSWTKTGELKDYDNKGRLREATTYKDGKRNGSHVTYYSDEIPFMICNYKNDQLTDTLRTYYPDGTFKRYEIYKDDVFLTGRVYTKRGGDTAFYRAQEPAVFYGGTGAMINYVKAHTKYPNKARRNNIQGKVLVKFVVGQKGNVEKAEVVKSVDPLLDKAAIDMVSNMPAWQPARQDGSPVKCYFHLPVNFRITDN